MWPFLLLLGGVGLVVAAGDSPSSSSSSGGDTKGSTGSAGGFAGETPPIEMTCDDAVAALPAGIRDGVAMAIDKGTSRDNLNYLADTLEAQANITDVSTDVGAYAAAALLVAAHCVRARASSLSTTAGASAASSAAEDPYAGPSSSYGYSTPPAYQFVGG